MLLTIFIIPTSILWLFVTTMHVLGRDYIPVFDHTLALLLFAIAILWMIHNILNKKHNTSDYLFIVFGIFYGLVAIFTIF